MPFKLRFIALVSILLLSLSLFGQSNDEMYQFGFHNSNKPQSQQNNYSTPLYDFRKSLNQLHEDLSEYHYVVDTEDLWFINSENMNFIKYQNKYQNGSLAGRPILHKKDIINILRKVYQDEYEYEQKMNDLSMIQYRYPFDEFMETRLKSMYIFSYGVKLEISNHLIPAIEDAIRNHPDNPQNPNNTLNDIVYSPEPEATHCHSVGPPGKGFMLGTKQLGNWCSYHQNGRLSQEFPYAHGERHGTAREYFDNGERRAEYTYWNGKKNGQSLVWWNNGNIRSKHYLEDDQLHGEARTWYKNGNPSTCWIYNYGKKNSRCPL